MNTLTLFNTANIKDWKGAHSHHCPCFGSLQTWEKARSEKEVRWCQTSAAGTFSQTHPPGITESFGFERTWGGFMRMMMMMMMRPHLGWVHQKHFKLSQMHFSFFSRKLKQSDQVKDESSPIPLELWRARCRQHWWVCLLSHSLRPPWFSSPRWCMPGCLLARGEGSEGRLENGNPFLRSDSLKLPKVMSRISFCDVTG